MALYDQHLHSWHSVDSHADPMDNARQAMRMGLAGISFTEHYDRHPDEWPLCVYDAQKIADSIAALRAEFGQQLFIGHGIEICYQPEQMSDILPMLGRHPFDVVLLSVHWFAGRALHLKEMWDGLNTATATRAYLESVLDAVRYVRNLVSQGRQPFSILGHLDLVKRYTQRYYNTFDIRSQRELVDEILQVALQSGIVPEVNTSSLRQGLDEPMPAAWVVKRYAELGGEAMSLGSDAHSAEHVGAGLTEGAAILKANGIKYLAVFKNRQLCPERLDD